ncbi:MAG: hypothetical protein KDK10_00890 [Maritimibacter sp.]|nr:hypothetical protein [Maritimibacter sp.]
MPNAMHSRGMLVAETDENGRVIHVWIKNEDDRIPQPVRGRARLPEGGLERYAVVGARRDDVTRWLASRA